jgi:hypothetical protein
MRAPSVGSHRIRIRIGDLLYRGVKDGMEIVMTAFDVSQFEAFEVEREIEILLNLRHPLIAWPIDFALAEGGKKLIQ